MMHATLSSGPSFFLGWIIATGYLPTHRTIFWLNCPVWCVLLPGSSSSYLEKVTFLTPSVASSTGLTSWSVFVSNYAFSRVGAFTGWLLHTCLGTVFRSARSPITPPFCRIWRSVHSCDEHCNHWPSGICGCLSCGMEQSSARTPCMTKAWVWRRSGKNWKLIYSKSTSKLLCDFGAWCKLLLTMLLWLS